MTPSRRLLSAVTAVLLLLAVSGCDDDSTASRAPCGAGTSNGCFDLGSYGNLYCTVQATRAWLESGRLTTDDLPAWADTSRRAGRVQVFDFRDPPASGGTGAQRTQELLNALRAKGLLQDTASLERRDDCLDGLTQAGVARTEGGWPAR
ncbi:hypothetical protein ASD11_16395 [Aeromicrobium sp. Root495]|uniref:hypothetical protein n=1 Tax=Aeromicrobium sp. Root495 TaxID=1736550 RepID=UPI0006F9BB9D|nr:hypothetical protein [Aeromicrobium sp. Root495]KQY56049.1 hypothetical protein ASD11_16395 [Aeromicrobium sp. Root495]